MHHRRWRLAARGQDRASSERLGDDQAVRGMRPGGILQGRGSHPEQARRLRDERAVRIQDGGAVHFPRSKTMSE